MTDIVAAARAEAARLGHDYIGSEHLFLALLESGDPSLGTILTSFNLDPAVVRERVERRAPKGRGAPSRKAMPRCGPGPSGRSKRPGRMGTCFTPCCAMAKARQQ